MQKIPVPASKLKAEIVSLAHQHPDARYIAVDDVIIHDMGDGKNWFASFLRDGPAMTAPGVFAAVPHIQSKFSLAA